MCSLIISDLAQDSDDEDVEEEIDAQIEQLLSAKRTVKNIDSAAMLGPAGLSSGGDQPPVALDKLALAKQLASKISIKAVAGGKGQTQVATEAFLKGGEGAGQTMITAKSVADHLAAKLNARLNYTPSDEPMLVEDGGIFQKFEEELEINDFPQQARWKVTSKEALAQISEYSEAGITVRGIIIINSMILESHNCFYHRHLLCTWQECSGGGEEALPGYREHTGAGRAEGQGGDHQAAEGGASEVADQRHPAH